MIQSHASRLVKIGRNTKILGVLKTMCLCSAIFNGSWPALIVAVFDCAFLLIEVKKYQFSLQRAAEIIFIRQCLARQAGQIASQNALLIMPTAGCA